MPPLCQHCDCYVGLAGAGVFQRPEGFDLAWLGEHCWGCGRSREQVAADPRGRPAGPFQPHRYVVGPGPGTVPTTP